MKRIKKYECVYQECINDCAVASLLTIIKTYGGNVSKEYLRVLTNTNKYGTNAYHLIEAAKFIGFDTRALSGDVTDLEKKNLPCIAHVIIDNKYKHFVVVHEIRKDYVVLADPANGIIKMNIQEFKKISTNNFFLFIPNKPLPCIKDDKSFINKIFKFYLKYKKLIVSIMFFSIFYTLTNIIISYGLQFIIEDAIDVPSINNLYFIIIFILLLTFVKCISDYVRLNIFNYINHKLDFILTEDVFKHLISLPYQYFKTRTTGDVLLRVNDLGNIKDTLSNLLLSVFVDGILIIFVFFTLIKINLYLTLFSLIIIILYLIIIKMFSNPIQEYVLKNKKEMSYVNTNFIESLELISTVKSLKLEDIVIQKTGDIYHRYLKQSYKFTKILNFQKLFKDLVNGGGLCLILFFGSLLVLKNKMTLTELITYNSLVIYFLEPLKNIIDSDVNIKNSKVSLKRIIELYSVEKEKLIIDEKYINNKIKGNISVKDLSYSYNGRNKILTKVSLEIKEGEKVLLTGSSGSGKSTLAKILMKYISIENDIVTLNDKDINDYNLCEIRRDICYVSQNESLITDSIYNNIVFGRNIDYDSFLSVCKKVGVDKIVNKNINGYNMLLEENGFNISGGERQRIIMCRALLKESSIYIFDESLNQIDIESEKSILTKIFKMYKDKTIIVISHRFNNNYLFDKVLSLEGGVLNY